MKPDSTLNYYNKNADQYIQQTRSVDMHELYQVFINSLPCELDIPQNILDVGCGSGRDSFYFAHKLGFKVTAIDGSAKMIERNKQYYATSDINWLNLTFAEIKDQGWENQFTGIWACASLLHVAYADLPALITTLINCLTTNGVIYLSFKHGSEQRIEAERFFCDMNQTRLLQVIEQLNPNNPIKCDTWITQDQNKQREVEWFNVLLIKL